MVKNIVASSCEVCNQDLSDSFLVEHFSEIQLFKDFFMLSCVMKNKVSVSNATSFSSCADVSSLCKKNQCKYLSLAAHPTHSNNHNVSVTVASFSYPTFQLL